ncbi:Cytochrome P450 94B3 like [Actinidia chinensis var. chinensis]|uniref:Cytochrome P450 94B3 like n=1 Tax=Actinidia chinensis var. chinensis TaxID=1590841 RepID=A0A2R6P8Y8_ACTCC|nr:Cytochrome P450 94B3 like [Actinidia chinensis var. chinensis]
MGLLFLSLFSSLCLLHVIVILSKLRRDPKFSAHGPPTYPVIGCLVSFYKNSHRLLDWYTHLLSESGNQTITIRRLGAHRTVVTANPKNVEYMLKTNFRNYPKGKAFSEILGDFLGCGIFNVDGELWHTQRKLASHEFSAKSLQDYVVNTLVEEVENKLFPKMESLGEKVVDLQELLRGFAFNIVCRVSLGIDPCNLDPFLSVSSLATAFNVASEMCARRSLEPVFVIWKIKRMIGVGSERRLREAIEEIHAFVTKIIHDKREAIGKDGVILGEDLLTKMILAGHDEKFLRDMMISFIMAGRDTTSAAMTWLFYLLSRHPEAEQEVMKEVSFVEDERLLHYEELKEMNFLKACICESMRLFPPVAWDSKHAIADDLLPDGTVVRGGDRVTYFPYGMGRMKALWGEDRFEFKPERWFLEPDQEGRGGLKKVCPYQFPVFQAGPRVCLGKEMAFIQMKYVVASILKRFEIRPSSLESPVFVPMLTAHMAGGFKVFVRRKEKPIAKGPRN